LTGVPRGGLRFFVELQVVQTADEQQIRDLLDHFQRVGDASRPEGVPDGVEKKEERDTPQE
jgi:hypothetical protein